MELRTPTHYLVTMTAFNIKSYDGIETEQHVPAELKERQQWLCYRIDGDDKIPKAPRWTVDGDLHVRNIGVRSNDEWTDFETASSFVQETQDKLPPEESLDGVGFVLTEDDPYAFLDLDHHISEGEISDLAQEWLDELNGWTEQSSSGDGLHVFVKSDIDMDEFRSRNDDIGVELYNDARFCAVTQDTLPNYSYDVPRANLLSLAEKYLAKEDDGDLTPIEPDWDVDTEKDADAAIETACAYDDEFETLHKGMSVHQDTSHDDVSYLTKCFFWAKGDESLVREMARQSNRPRAKWEESRDGGTWFDNRVAEAQRFQDETFSGDYL